ncbi:VOC family protein [Rahnella ecdela]|uniref:VOC family protein n=1 Tax=Rahnella ecdela TaxID=2816250 RepID=A0ABS6LJG0_9GAMM|nr:VOC family protein [Rahnella ecdela]MBU9846995.1 VOC family protein [Rahnella ecdela]
MISHICIGVNDFRRAFTFYSAVMAELGHVLKFCDAEKPWAAWMAPCAPRPLFVIGQPHDGGTASAGNGQMVALLAERRDTVDQIYQFAMANGATDEGAPGLRPHYHADYYGAYFRDADGNKVCICCHHPESLSPL